MRLALIIAFVSCVIVPTERADARPGDRVAEAKKVQKRKAPTRATKTRAPAKVAKAKPKAEPAKQEAAVEEPKVEEPKKTAVVANRGAPVSQASDDEVPRNQPAKKKR